MKPTVAIATVITVATVAVAVPGVATAAPSGADRIALNHNEVLSESLGGSA